MARPCNYDFATYNFDDLKPIPHPMGHSAAAQKQQDSRDFWKKAENGSQEVLSRILGHSSKTPMCPLRSFGRTDPQVFPCWWIWHERQASWFLASSLIHLLGMHSRIYFGAGN